MEQLSFANDGTNDTKLHIIKIMCKWQKYMARPCSSYDPNWEILRTAYH